jgi:hypothetical protein
LRSALLQKWEDVKNWMKWSFKILKLVPELDAKTTRQTILDLIKKLKQSAHPVKKENLT